MRKTLFGTGRTFGIAELAVSLLTIYLTFFGPVRLTDPGLGDSLFFLLLAFHFVWAAILLLDYRAARRKRLRHLYRFPELLLAFTLMQLLFAYIYATNANMGYVQRFIANGGNLRLALNTATERSIVLIRYLPFLLVDAAVFVVPRLRNPLLARRICSITRRPRNSDDRRGGQLLGVWSFPLILTGAFVTAISFPSFLNENGIGFLGWISIVPLLLVLKSVGLGRGVFYGVVHGVFVTMLSNYWLATFSLVSLQFAVGFFLLFYLLFMPVALLAYRLTPVAKFLVFPLAWTAFEYARSVGFFGYPWVLFAHTQVTFLPLLQVASFTGVWGVSFLVLLGNAGLAETLYGWIAGRRRTSAPVVSASTVIAIAVLYGGIVLIQHPVAPRSTGPSPTAGNGSLVSTAAASSPGASGDVVANGGTATAAGAGGPGTASATGTGRTVRVALIQQNSDPRKSNYRVTLNTLERLTNGVLPEHPQLIAWSETAFVPNIRRWSAEDPNAYDLASIVHDFLAYQRSIHSWLVTGNDDYTLVMNSRGQEVDRLDYNASVLFSPDGRRVQTYHKIKLVPFTEYFPYKAQLPGVYKLLENFDVHFWQPGESYTVFKIPSLAFSTPICFEDAFPGHVRRFVLAGAQVILNLSNDYWSLTDVEAQQHFYAGLFRSIENRRPVLRSTASGVTAYVDPYGRVIARLPFYRDASLVADVHLGSRPRTAYTLLGDWFPIICALGLVLMSAGAFVRFLLYGRQVSRGVPER